MNQRLFDWLLSARSSDEVDRALEGLSGTWLPLGSNENNFGVIENQQASPIAALIEKLTNSIDAILMRRCLEAGINPKGMEAPDSMHSAIETFFPADHKNWNLTGVRRKQAQSIQILAAGSRTKPCLTIYDDGEGQHPRDFERTFLSLLQGNKNEIPFVQGKYNMGGTGAIVFCGEHRYQLIGSKRFDGTGEFGFTLIRKHPLSAEEKKTKKNTWYEYLKIDGKIPSFPITELDLGLAGDRKFTTGTIIKLFDYQLPAGSRGGLPQEVRRSLNQFLFEPALPIYLKDSPERYPNNKVLEGDTFGLKRRLEEDDSRYIQEHFTDEFAHKGVGSFKATCYVFRAKVDGKTVKETRDAIDREFFPDGMCVLFSLNGQVHGHLGRQFISTTLKMPLLKNHLLIHVDCTGMDYDFRSELFMASRDRLKSGEKTAELRQLLKDVLIKSRLTEIYKQRKNSISVEGGDAKDLLKAFSKNLPFNKDLMRLLNQTFKIEQHDEEKKKPDNPEKLKEKKHKEPFQPQRYPSFFKLKSGEGKQFLTIPERDEKTIQFSTDVEDSYFDRSEDPGDLKVSILQHRNNETDGGTLPGMVDSPEELLDIRKSSPKDGTIRIGLGATSELKVGDELEITATLGGPEDFECRFWVKITKPNEKPKEVKKEDEEEEPPMGLPDYSLVYEHAPEETPDALTWEKLGESVGIDMDWEVPMFPSVGEDGNLERVYINMDSRVLRNFKSRQGNIGADQAELSEKKYISSVYFHTIFLFSITKNKKYELKQGEKEVDLQDYLKDVFSSYYSEFLLNFGMEDLIATMAD
ncbi:hypothetical protein Hsar01_00616 [Haloferula sargassicola]|uniref:Histidine kinase-, DNA gyrase B-, and HSP90-like ATPase n=2 Tax=Haloferula sargassicola TaxID=490096 RepID=A0ABP9UJ44_9BACT